jgi:hypothetical protein
MRAYWREKSSMGTGVGMGVEVGMAAGCELLFGTSVMVYRTRGPRGGLKNAWDARIVYRLGI